MQANKGKIEEILTRGVSNVIPGKTGLYKLLTSGKKLNIYAGFDATAPKLTLGHTVPFRKLQALSDLGHNVTFLIGDFTTLIGDNSDKENERPALTKEQIKKNFRTYKKQASKILDFSKIKVKFNSEWLSKLNFDDVVKLSQNFSTGDFISRELVRKRLDSGKRVGLHEMLYPIMQGYDHYIMDTDLQIGATEQTFNMQAGRTLQKKLRGKESFVMTLGILEGTDGRRMSKSWGNAIWIEDDPDEIYGKVMSLRDDLIIDYFTLATNLEWEKVKEIEKHLKDGDNPFSFKHTLARQIVTEFHSIEDSTKAANSFENTFQKGKPKYKKLKTKFEDLATVVGEQVGSNSEAKRLIAQGSVDLNDTVIKDPKHEVKIGDKIKIGKKTFVEIK